MSVPSLILVRGLLIAVKEYDKSGFVPTALIRRVVSSLIIIKVCNFESGGPWYGPSGWTCLNVPVVNGGLLTLASYVMAGTAQRMSVNNSIF